VLREDGSIIVIEWGLFTTEYRKVSEYNIVSNGEEGTEMRWTDVLYEWSGPRGYRCLNEYQSSSEESSNC